MMLALWWFAASLLLACAWGAFVAVGAGEVGDR